MRMVLLGKRRKDDPKMTQKVQNRQKHKPSCLGTLWGSPAKDNLMTLACSFLKRKHSPSQQALSRKNCPRRSSPSFPSPQPGWCCFFAWDEEWDTWHVKLKVSGRPTRKAKGILYDGYNSKCTSWQQEMWTDLSPTQISHFSTLREQLRVFVWPSEEKIWNPSSLGAQPPVSGNSPCVWFILFLVISCFSLGNNWWK